MNIFVCAKQVPDDEAKIVFSEGKPYLEGISRIVNAFDGYAVEMALQHCENAGGEVSVLTLGEEKEVRASAVQLLAVGAKHAYIGKLPDKADPSTTADALAALIGELREEGNACDLILCGKESTDEIGSQTGAMLAEKCGLPLVTSVVAFEETPDGVKAKKETEDGYEYYLVQTPAVFTIAKPDYDLRYPSIKSKMAARKAQIPVKDGIEAKASVFCKGYEEPAKRSAGIRIQEEEDVEAVKKAMDQLVADKVL